MPYQQPPPIHHLSDDALRTLVQAIGRGAPAPAAFPAARENHGSRNRSIAIAKLITKFHGEGDPITYVERFEQICAAFGDVSDGNKIGAFGIQLEGKCAITATNSRTSTASTENHADESSDGGRDRPRLDGT